MVSPSTELEPVLRAHINRRLAPYAKLLPQRMLVHFRNWAEDMITAFAFDPAWMKPLRDLPPVDPWEDSGKPGLSQEGAERLLAELGFALAKSEVARKDHIADRLAEHAAIVAFGVMCHAPNIDGRDPETCSRELSRLLDISYACLFGGMIFGFKVLSNDEQTQTSEYLWAAMAFREVVCKQSKRDAKLLWVYLAYMLDLEEVAEREGVPFSTEQAELFGFLERFGAAVEAAGERIAPRGVRPGDRLSREQSLWITSMVGQSLKSDPRDD